MTDAQRNRALAVIASELHADETLRAYGCRIRAGQSRRDAANALRAWLREGRRFGQ